MKLTKHRKMSDGSFTMAVHTDPDKTLEAEHPLVLDEATPHKEGDPDPEFVKEFTWPARDPEMRQWVGDPKADPPVEPGPKVTEAEYVEMQRREAKALIEQQQQLEQPQPRERGKKLPGEGEEL